MAFQLVDTPAPRRAPGDATSPRHEDALVSRVRDGDAAAFEALFDAHYGTLCDFVCSYVRAADVAEDLVQTVFLRLWARRASWTPAGGVRAYLFTACRNQAVDHLRHQQMVARKAADTAALAIGAGGGGREPRRPDAELEASELDAELRRAVHALPERRRLVVIMRWQHQLSNAEIARALGISEKGVETQFGRALASLRKLVKR